MGRVLARVVAAFALLVLAAGGARLGGFGLPASASQQQPPSTDRPSALQPPAAPASEARSPRIANYSIDARLDPSTRAITGSQALTWRNASTNPVSTLQFHLYYNAWRNAQSTWMREWRLAGNTDADDIPDESWARMDLGSVQIERQGDAREDLTGRIRFIAPDDGNADDRTVVEVPLADPVQPGETVSVRMEWSSRVPRTFARTGAIGSYYFLAHWFPKIGVLQESGWNCHQFHAATEFFSDFGTYDVRLTVPSGWLVGATGTEKERRDRGDGTTVHRYYQEDVHDFAWTASPNYLEVTGQFTDPKLPPVQIRLLLQPEHRGQEERHFAAARAALKHFGEWLGPYPYGHLTIVDPAWQSGAEGMEYPTLLTAGTRWLAPRHASDPEDVTIHEVAHQFLHGIVATNEFEHAWLDEGLTTFAATRVLAHDFDPNFAVRRYFGGFIPWIFRDLPLSRQAETATLASYRSAGRTDVPSTPTWQYWPGNHWGPTYFKTSLWLHTLEKMLGWETLQRAFSTYFARWAFRHPQPEDFFAILNEVSGRDLGWFFDQVHRSAVVFDYGVDVFRSERLDSNPADRAPAAREATSGQATFRTTVVARRYGEGRFPVDIKVSFENDEEIRWQWDGRERWKLFEVDKPARAVRAEVDPDRVLLLDISPTNNSAVLESAGPRAARKWSLVWLIWLQDHLLTQGFFI
jgi:hypothetical protein